MTNDTLKIKKIKPQRKEIKPSGKKEKIFLDTTQMLKLIGDVNNEEEGIVDKKLTRMNKVGEINQKRQEKMSMRAQEKQEYLETVKNSLRKKRKRVNCANVTRISDDASSTLVQHKDENTVKRVSFK